MAVVIDEMESTVEPDTSREASGGGESGSKQEAQPFAQQKLAAEIHRIAVRCARLKAD